jgi:hypothetical protein
MASYISFSDPARALAKASEVRRSDRVRSEKISTMATVGLEGHLSFLREVELMVERVMQSRELVSRSSRNCRTQKFQSNQEREY